MTIILVIILVIVIVCIIIICIKLMHQFKYHKLNEYEFEKYASTRYIRIINGKWMYDSDDGKTWTKHYHIAGTPDRFDTSSKDLVLSVKKYIEVDLTKIPNELYSNLMIYTNHKLTTLSVLTAMYKGSRYLHRVNIHDKVLSDKLHAGKMRLYRTGNYYVLCHDKGEPSICITMNQYIREYSSQNIQPPVHYNPRI